MSGKLANSKRTPRPRRRPAFTLVELMVVLIIIGLLGSMIMFAMFSAQATAREAKTKNMISKLNALIMRKYESYATRRVPIHRAVGAQPESDESLHYRRLQAVRDLMRMEMPECWPDIFEHTTTKPLNTDGPLTAIPVPSVTYTYKRKVEQAHRRPETRYSDTLQGAESLYLIVAFGLDDPDALSHFSQSDIGDTDGDGLLEFLDGWGQPISFLRWPAGFGPTNSTIPERRSFEVDAVGRQTRDETKDFDQFNTRRIADRILNVQPQPPQDMPRRFALYPLIYSGGPDQKKDIKTGTIDAQGNGSPPRYCVKVNQHPPPYFSAHFIDPYLPLQDAQGWFQVGTPGDTDGSGTLDHGDNIHNQNLIVR